MNFSFIRFLPVLAVWIFISSCREDIHLPDNGLKPEGVYILNEGSYGSATGDISFFDPDSMKIINNLFLNANGSPAGDILQDMLIHDTLGIIVVNNSNKIRIVNINTFKLIKDISVTMPRRIVRASSTKAYISCWNGFLQILDLQQMAVTGSVAMPEQYPEGMLALGNRVYVALSSGFDWGVVEGAHRGVAVVDVITDSVTCSIPAGYNPLELAYDENRNRIYAACGGSEFTAPKAHGGIYIINASSHLLIDSIISKPGDAGPDTLYVSNIWITGNHCYFINHFAGPVTIFNMQSRYITGNISGNFYNVAVDPYHDLILATTMSADGKLKVFNLALEPRGEFNAGEFPSTIVFRYK